MELLFSGPRPCLLLQIQSLDCFPSWHRALEHVILTTLLTSNCFHFIFTPVQWLGKPQQCCYSTPEVCRQPEVEKQGCLGDPETEQPEQVRGVATTPNLLGNRLLFKRPAAGSLERADLGLLRMLGGLLWTYLSHPASIALGTKSRLLTLACELLSQCIWDHLALCPFPQLDFE